MLLVADDLCWGIGKLGWKAASKTKGPGAGSLKWAFDLDCKPDDERLAIKHSSRHMRHDEGVGDESEDEEGFGATWS